MTTHIHRLQRAKAWLAAGTVLAVLTALAVGFAAAPAQAFPSTHWEVDSIYQFDLPSGWAEGRFVWENRSVRVGASLDSADGQDCVAVVFTAYDRSGRQVARAARPGDSKYTCGAPGYGFTLNASHVRGGIRTIVVDLYHGDDGGFHAHIGRKVYHRP